MSKIDTGGPAFPWDEKSPDGSHYHSNGGMTLLDWFAGRMDTSDIQFPSAESAAEALGIDGPKSNDPADLLELSHRVNARLRYDMAAAMLAEKSRREAAS